MTATTEAMRAPWKQGDWVYATNGHIIIRVPAEPALDWPQMLLLINAYAGHVADAAQHQAASRADISHAAALKALTDIRMAMAAHTSRWQALVHELIWRATPQEAPARQGLTEATCHWSQEDEGSGTYWTACGRSFMLNNGGPTDNGLQHCCYCGKPLVEVPWVEPEPEPDAGIPAPAAREGE